MVGITMEKFGSLPAWASPTKAFHRTIFVAWLEPRHS